MGAAERLVSGATWRPKAGDAVSKENAVSEVRASVSLEIVVRGETALREMTVVLPVVKADDEDMVVFQALRALRTATDGVQAGLEKQLATTPENPHE